MRPWSRRRSPTSCSSRSFHRQQREYNGDARFLLREYIAPQRNRSQDSFDGHRARRASLWKSWSTTANPPRASVRSGTATRSTLRLSLSDEGSIVVSGLFSRDPSRRSCRRWRRASPLSCGRLRARLLSERPGPRREISQSGGEASATQEHPRGENTTTCSFSRHSISLALGCR